MGNLTHRLYNHEGGKGEGEKEAPNKGQIFVKGGEGGKKGGDIKGKGGSNQICKY